MRPPALSPSMDLVRREADRGAAAEFVALDIRGEAESPGNDTEMVSLVARLDFGLLAPAPQNMLLVYPNRCVFSPFLVVLLRQSIAPEKLMESSFAGKEFERDRRADANSSSTGQCSILPVLATLNSGTATIAPNLHLFFSLNEKYPTPCWFESGTVRYLSIIIQTGPKSHTTSFGIL